MPSIGDVKRASDLGFVSTGLVIFEACPSCGKARWHRKERHPSLRLCPECGRKAGAVSAIDKTRNWKRASELGKTLKKDLIFYQDSCPVCGTELWHRRRDIGKRMCNECHKKAATRTGETHGMWRGGRHLRKDGYVGAQVPKDSPYASMRNRSGSVLEHRLIMAEHLGRPLQSSEIVHHINKVRHDNRLSNLELLPKQAVHLSGILGDAELRRLKQEIADLRQQVRLLTWHIIQWQQGNPELSTGQQPVKCVETMGFVSPDDGDSEIVQSSWKQEGATGSCNRRGSPGSHHVPQGLETGAGGHSERGVPLN